VVLRYTTPGMLAIHVPARAGSARAVLMPTTMPTSVELPLLVWTPDAARAQHLRRVLQQSGRACTIVTNESELLSQVGAAHSICAPQHLVLIEPVASLSPLLDRLNEAGGGPPQPASWIGSRPLDFEPLVSTLAWAWWPIDLLDDDAQLVVALRTDAARRRRDVAAQGEIKRLRSQLDERIWVERAKGVLMSASGITEETAFGLLRDGSMHANLRVGEVSRAVIESAGWADAVNRAGQLRMLSQRLVKLAAQRLHRIDSRQSVESGAEAANRIQANLDFLASQASIHSGPPDLRDALLATQAAWLGLKALVTPPPSVDSLIAADAQADVLLAHADHLTGTLEAAAGRRALRIVNLCGRQRMRVQRLGKFALLCALRHLPLGTEQWRPHLDEFEAALCELEKAPLSSVGIRDALTLARGEWSRLIQGLNHADPGERCRILSRKSDALLDTFDHLTDAYEHSLQLLMS